MHRIFISGIGDELLDAADELTLTLRKCSNGGTNLEYHVRGLVSCTGDVDIDDITDLAELRNQKPDDRPRRLAQRALDSFVKGGGA